MSLAPLPLPRSVSILEVARPALWTELSAVLDLSAYVQGDLGPNRRIVGRSFEAELPNLRKKGIRVLVRYARRSAAEVEEARHDLEERIERLPKKTREVLHRAQRHDRDGVVIGSHVWDPVWEAEAVDTLHGAGLIEALPGDDEPRHGRYRLHPDLPPPPDRVYDFAEAVMERTEDLSEPSSGPLELLHDLAALSAALQHHSCRRTLSGSLQKSDAKKLGRWMGSAELAETGVLNRRWARALEALEVLGAVSMDPIERTLYAEPHLESVLEGTSAEALDRLLHRLVDRDLQAALPALRDALAQAGDQALDELIVLELLEEQHRDVIFAPWLREGQAVYPQLEGMPVLPWTSEAFEQVEGRMVAELLSVLKRLGLIVRAPGVFAATEEGRLWASGTDPDAAPVWVSSDLEVLVPPNSVTPWERYQLERLGRCIKRDVVDRYKLERGGLEAWLATHELEAAVELLRRRSPGLPSTVIETLTEWERSATRFVLTRGVLLGG